MRNRNVKIVLRQEVTMSVSRTVSGVILLVVSCAVAVTVEAGFSGTEVFLPSVGRGPGAANSQWRTAVWLHNPSSDVANVQIFFLERDQPNPSPAVFNIAVGPGETVRTYNVMAELFGGEGFGALRVVSDRKIFVNSRIYSTPQGDQVADSVGQFFAAVPASFAIAQGQSTELLGVNQTSPQGDSQYRYNFGFVETKGQPVVVRATAHNGAGSPVGSKDYALMGYQPSQYNIADLIPGVDSTNLRIRVEVISGPGEIVVFGSSLANRSNDPSTFEMLVDEESVGGGFRDWERVRYTETLTIASDELGSATAYCPPGKRALGGGGWTSGNRAILVDSWPTPPHEGRWTASFWNHTDDTIEIWVAAFVICATTD